MPPSAIRQCSQYSPVSRQRSGRRGFAETRAPSQFPARAEMLSVAEVWSFKTKSDPIWANDYKRLMNFSMLMSACRKIARGVPRSSRS